MTNSINLRKQKTSSSAEQEAHARALRLLSLTIFLLMADPLMNLYIGPVPLYAIDILALLTWVSASRIPSTRRYPLQDFVVFILIAMLISEFLAGIELGTLVQPAYIIARTLLAISLFFSTTRIIQCRSDLETMIKGALLGALITGALMIASSFPQTQGIIARRVFSISFLMPSADNVASKYGFAEMAMRGQSLVGVSILSAAFLNTIWPLLFLLRTDEKGGARWKAAKFLAILLIPLGVILSYSRGAITGLVMIVLIALLLSSGKVRAPVVIGAGIAVLIIYWVGWGSEYFKFEWLQEKTEYQFEYAYQSDDMTARIYAYSDPFILVQEKPVFLLWGQGFARKKIPGATMAGGANHAVFAAATYGYGMLAAFAYVGMLLGAFKITFSNAWGAKDEFLTMFSRALLAGLFGFSSWFILGLAGVSEPRGAMLLFFLFGLVAAQSNFSAAPEAVQIKPKPSSGGKFRRRPLPYNRPTNFGS